jgi:23S rRNA pseudouridine1911/1915/1917 synthase
LVHRLDTDTSGVLLVARTPPAYVLLKAQFAAQTIRKRYLALVSGDVESAGEISAPIGATRRGSRRVRVQSGTERAGRGYRPALTHYRPTKRFGNCTLVSVEIPTGVRHQIRAHLASIHHPVLGDSLYGGEAAPRQMLHAERILFLHPQTRAPVSVESPLPDDMRKEMRCRSRGARTERHRKPPPPAEAR